MTRRSRKRHRPRRRRSRGLGLWHRKSFRHIEPGASPGLIRTHPEASPSRIRVIAYGPDDLIEEQIERVEDLERHLGRWPVTWVNIDGLGNAATLEAIGRIFKLHPLALEDVVNVFQRAKVEVYGDDLFVVARMVELAEELNQEQFSLFLGPDFVLTFQETEGDSFDPVRERLRGGRAKIRGSGPDYLAYALIDALIDHYFPVLEAYGERLEHLEEEVLGDPARESVARIQEVKRDLLALRRAAWPHREAINQLWRDDSPRVSEDTRIYLRDCYDHTVQLMDMIENYREMGSSLMDLYLSTLSNRMNDIMKVLTIIATIFIPLSFVAGLYGMNFDPDASPWNMPELGWYWGYPFTLGLMLVIAGGMLWYFRHSGWIFASKGRGDSTETGSDGPHAAGRANPEVSSGTRIDPDRDERQPGVRP